VTHGQQLPSHRPARLRIGLRWLAAVFYVAAGLNHFIKPSFYREIVPPGFPNPALLVTVSGVFEVAGGIGLLVRPLRRVAGWGLVALLVAVFPANVYMAVHPDRIPNLHVPQWILWLRLPLQAILIVWVWFVSLARRTAR
jgi:uncharacterized membrane protein